MPFKGHAVGICKDFQCYTTELRRYQTTRKYDDRLFSIFTGLRGVADGRTDRLR